VEGQWAWRSGDAPLPADLLAAVGDGRCAPVVARLLWNRGIRDGESAEAFLRPTLARGLRAPHLMQDLERAAVRLADALARGERIAIYGDYDVDGMSSAAELVLFLRELGTDPLLHVAHRAHEGYGLSAAVLRRLRAAGARVVVTADLGTANVAELGLAQELGLDVIVCDHHHLPAVRPPAYALLNPLQPGCRFPFKGLAAAGVVFYLLMGLRAELRARGHAPLPDLRAYLDLVALGTVADVVPLREENRVLVAHGLRVLERTARPGLRALKEVALVDRATVRAIGFRLAPRLNAGGRLADARLAVDLLTTESPERGRGLAAELELHNATRRAVEERMLAEAMAAVAAGQRDAPALVVAGQGWHEGVVGIVAARLVDRFHRPVLAVALAGEEGRGSGRSPEGMHLLAALAACGDVLERFGGHRQAAGFVVRAERLPELRRRFAAAVHREQPALGAPRIDIDAELSLAAVTPRLAEALAALEPHGPGNPEPRFLARDVRVESVQLVGDPTRPHLRLRLRHEGRTLRAIGFGMGREPVHAGDRVDVVFTPRLDRWQGVDRLEVEVVALRAASASELVQPSEISAEALIP
jgi:single-stranded-DNA-specific exonuclease